MVKEKKGNQTKKLSNHRKLKKRPRDRWYSKILPATPDQIHYTPEELRYKFTQYALRADKENQEVTISGFAVYANTSRRYLFDKKSSQDFSHVVDKIMAVFEASYEERAAKWYNVSYILNNRFKWEWESVQKNENTENLHPDIRNTLDGLIAKSKQK